MKRVCWLLLVVLGLTSFKSKSESEECDVVEFYKGIEPDSDVKVLTSMGELEEAELILVPTKMEVGTFKIEVTKKGSNIYKIEGTELYIETKYCYELAVYDEAILKVVSNYGYEKGVIIFDL